MGKLLNSEPRYNSQTSSPLDLGDLGLSRSFDVHKHNHGSWKTMVEERKACLGGQENSL
jgi:hypothetical protein